MIDGWMKEGRKDYIKEFLEQADKGYILYASTDISIQCGIKEEVAEVHPD